LGAVLTKLNDTERRLVAIFAADVEGYSRLMRADEVGTLRDLTQRRAILDGLIGSHRGRIANTAGDSVLAEFGSAVDAVQCAVVAALAKANAGASPDRHINFRIGVHVGDVMVRAGDLFGDGVNIAARLQTLASAGGTCISGVAYDQVRKLLPFAFTDLGAQQVKNIEEPVRAFAVSAKGGPAGVAPASVSLALPDKPSIAVLPFQNMSGDPEQEYFADGMVEEIITALSRVRSFFVIARNSSFTYKGKLVDIKQVGRELGVRYVLEGSVRKAGGKVRITGQLIEAATGHHVWADRFDGGLDDVFELQDRVSESVVAAIEPNVKLAEINRARAKPTNHLDAYDCYLRALPFYYQFTRDGSDAAIDYLHRAIELHPQYALAKAFLAYVHITRALQGWGEPIDRAEIIRLSYEGIIADPDDPSTLKFAGHALAFGREYDRALAALKKAAELNVNGSQILTSLGWVQCYACVEPLKAIQHFERAMRLSPRDNEMAYILSGISFANLIACRNEEALLFAEKSIQERPEWAGGHRCKITALALLGRLEESKMAAKVLLDNDPKFSISARVPTYPDPAFQKRYYDALKASGLPE
jgi:adenylate cyclase